MMKHTLEPWTYEGTDPMFNPLGGLGLRWISGASGRRVASMAYEPDAARICACVNACAGIADPSVVLELVEALRSCVAALTVGTGAKNEEWYNEAIRDALAALTKVKGDGNES